MGNIAQNILPMEAWGNSAEATNGNTKIYTGTSGFTFAKWPTTYTLDLLSVKRISVIRFLLWDGLGHQRGGQAHKRKYRYRLSTSDNNKSWIRHYETPGLGYNGWQMFDFKNNLSARYVRLECVSHSDNGEFHIVEFEVHDSPPPPLDTPIVNYHQIFSTATTEKYYKDYVKESEEEFNKLREKITSDANEVEDVKVRLTQKNSELDSVIEKLELTGKSLNFSHQARINKSAAKNWMIYSIVSIGLFLVILFWFFNNGFQFTRISTTASVLLNKVKNPHLIYTTVVFEFFKVIIFKLLLTSISIYAIVLGVKNYNTAMHNYTINTHKALALSSAIELLDKPTSPEARDKLLIQATQVIFAHQTSGYSGKDGDIPNPNIIASVFENVQSKLK